MNLHNYITLTSVSIGASLVAQSSESKESARNVGDTGLIPESGRSPGEGNGNPLQYSCLKNSTDREACRLQSMGSQRVRHNQTTYFHYFQYLLFLEKIPEFSCMNPPWV